MISALPVSRHGSKDYGRKVAATPRKSGVEEVGGTLQLVLFDHIKKTCHYKVVFGCTVSVGTVSAYCTMAQQ